MDRSWHAKYAAYMPAQGNSGHWRTIPTWHEGHDEGGSIVHGRTWVSQNNMRTDLPLMSHQISGTKAALNIKNPSQQGLLYAWGTGTGKTGGAVNTFETLKGQGKVSRALVLTPAALRNNFLTEGVQKFTTSKGAILEKPEELPSGTEYAIVSYDAFRNRPQEFLEKLHPDMVIADELQKATTEGGKTNESLMTARKSAPYFLGLTASSTSNSPADFAPVMNILSGGSSSIGTREIFKRQFLRRVKNNDRGIFGGAVAEERLVNHDLLLKRIGPVVHYVEDLDATRKPPKVVERVETPMSPEQLKLYRMTMKGVDPVIADKIRRGEPVASHQLAPVFARLQRARQIANSVHAGYSKLDPESAIEFSPKVKRLLEDADEHLKQVPDAQVIMYTNVYHGGVDILSAGLKKRGIPFGVFAGRGQKDMTEESRQQAVNDYKSRKNKVIIITQAGAEGLSLGDTTLVQMLDPHYNPERTNQAMARGIRAGGQMSRPVNQRKVIVKQYVTTIPRTIWQRMRGQPAEHSVDQWITGISERKGRLNAQMRSVLKQRSDIDENARNRGSLW